MKILLFALGYEDVGHDLVLGGILNVYYDWGEADIVSELIVHTVHAVFLIF